MSVSFEVLDVAIEKPSRPAPAPGKLELFERAARGAASVSPDRLVSPDRRTSPGRRVSPDRQASPEQLAQLASLRRRVNEVRPLRFSTDLCCLSSLVSP
jgi:hypothetical protein